MPISVSAVYSLEEFKRNAALKDDAYQSAVKAGLRTLKVGKRRYVRGEDWESFLLDQNNVSAGENQ